ncbi:MAG: 50S ribosomal protein L25 [Bacteroidia bacterium]|nr:50S ribosomal protein L25 [Bacteroidia bacterium]
MLTTALSGTLRENLGTTAAKAYREAGQVPAVIYRPAGALHFTLHVNDVNKLLASRETYLYQITVGNETLTTIFRSAQFHPVHDYVLDLEFALVEDTRPITVDLPLKLVGTSPGMTIGGKLIQKLRKVRVKGLVSKLPQEVVADISHLNLGKSMKIREMKPEGYSIVMSGDIPLATIEIPRSLRQEYAKENPGPAKK